jgi:endonuclease/exonuclease/phosphatase family metal-dependent hydrolase
VLVALPASPATAFDPLSGDYSRDEPLDIRIVTYNHARNFIDDSSTDAAFDRILTALDPDIVCFQEFVSGVSESDVVNRMNAIIPINGSWQVHFGLLGGIRTVIASRFPLTMERVDTIPTSATRGVTIALADLPDSQYEKDIYLMGVHLKCCGSPGGSEDASRQDSADAIANWLGNARGEPRPSGNQVSLPFGTPMINLGDFNLVGGPQPETTLITGDIQDEGVYGPDVKGDWDNSNMNDLNPVDPFTGDDFTWQGNGNFPPGRLDRIFFTDSVVTVANSFILNTDTMTGQALNATGLEAEDTLPSTTSDHLPVAVDIRGFVSGGCSGDQDCNDGLFCNGVESCVGQECVPGTPVACDDDIACTDDTCNELTDACEFTAIDANCDDGLFCNGAEVCILFDGCQSTTAPDCDDGLECTADSCNESTDSCDHQPDNALCDDGLICNGFEICLAGVCQNGSPLNCDDGNRCTEDLCNDELDICEHIPSDLPCDDGLFCNGAETCNVIFGCQAGVAPDCSDGVDCTVDACDEAADACAHDPDDGACDDGLFCNGTESCHPVNGCEPGSTPCSGKPCDETGDLCSIGGDVPAVGEWGVLVLALALLAVGGIVFRRPTVQR